MPNIQQTLQDIYTALLLLGFFDAVHQDKRYTIIDDGQKLYFYIEK